MTRGAGTVIIAGSVPEIIVPVARSIHRAGLQCIVALPPGASFAPRSRSIADVVHLDGSAADAAAMLGLLAKAQRASCILPAGTDALRIITGDYARLSGRCPVACPPPDAVARLLEANTTMQIAWRAQNAHAITATERDTWGVVSRHVSLLVSEMGILAVFQDRTESRDPGGRNARSRVISESPDPQLVTDAHALVRSFGWTGIARVEFSVSNPDTAPVAVSATGTFWNSISLPISLGIDFPLLAWKFARGEHAKAPPSYRAEVSHECGRPPGQGSLASIARIASLSVQALHTLGVRKGVRYVAHQATGRFGLGRTQRLPGKIESVLFVCHANVIRSAAAEAFLASALRKGALPPITVTSAGTHARSGSTADPRLLAIAAELGRSLREHRSRALTQQMVDSADVIFAMDYLNAVDVESAFPSARHKLLLLGGLGEAAEWKGTSVADPVGATDEVFEQTVREIHRLTTSLQKQLATRARD